jgi:hypothetical protein
LKFFPAGILVPLFTEQALWHAANNERTVKINRCIEFEMINQQ